MCIQIKDSVIIKGDKYTLCTCPLDSYWTRRNPKPQIRITSTTCWRGYVATWEIFEQRLYLVDLLFHAPEDNFGLDYVFPGITGKVKALWYSGELNIPMGEELYQEHMLDPVYAVDLYLCIQKGNAIKQRYKANY